MKNKISILALILSIGLVGCNSKVKKEETQPQNEVIEELIEAVKSETNASSTFDEIWQSLPLKSTPITENTNFDNIKDVKKLNVEDIAVLQLKKIYPNIDKEGDNYKFQPAYKLAFSDKFYTIILNVFKGDHELESILIIYNSDNKLSQYYNQEGKLANNSLVIAYDEIAEGQSRKFSTIKNNNVTIIDESYGDKVQIDTTKFHINSIGDINQIKTKFSSNLRPNDPIVLNKRYIDTIEFSSYNDDYDYRMIEGKMNEKNVALIYNWDWQNNERYNFKNGDLLKVTWKMDSIYSAGDGETLDFSERAIEAERIENKNKSVKFLWRADKFNEELNQTINSIIINESFVNSISHQEKAALGYVATFIGNECMWDGNVNEDRSNLKCKILTTLDLGYQCSDTHLGFLKHWFSQDEIVLKKLETCRTIPESATVQSTFDEITIVTDEDYHTIKVNYKVRGINLRESTTKSWSQTDFFEFTCESINLVNSEKFEIENKD